MLKFTKLIPLFTNQIKKLICEFYLKNKIQTEQI